MIRGRNDALTVYNLETRRLRTLQRVRSTIDELEIVLRDSQGGPHDYLVISLLKSLRGTAARLESGLHHGRLRG